MLNLRELQYSSIEHFKAGENCSFYHLSDRLIKRLRYEEELLIDPKIFNALKKKYQRFHM